MVFVLGYVYCSKGSPLPIPVVLHCMLTLNSGASSAFSLVLKSVNLDFRNGTL
jgi:hypothetical protein